MGILLKALYFQDKGSNPVACEIYNNVNNTSAIVDMFTAFTLASSLENVVVVSNGNKKFFRQRKGYDYIRRERINEQVIKSLERKNEDHSSRRKGCSSGSKNVPVKAGEGSSSNTSRRTNSGVLRKGCYEDESCRVRTCNHPDLIPCYKVSPRAFKNAFWKEHKHLNKDVQFFVDKKSEAELKDCKCLSFDKGRAFVAVTKDGDIVSLMRSPRSDETNFLIQAIAYSVSLGGNKLDCYAKDGFGLGHLYSSCGFIPVCKLKFDPSCASDDWRPELGMPDLIFFMYIGDSVDDLIKNYLEGKYPFIADYDYIPYVTDFPVWKEQSGCEDDYSFALHIRDTVLEKWISKYKSSFRGTPTKIVEHLLKDVR